MRACIRRHVRLGFPLDPRMPSGSNMRRGVTQSLGRKQQITADKCDVTEDPAP